MDTVPSLLEGEVTLSKHALLIYFKLVNPEVVSRTNSREGGGRDCVVTGT